MQSEEFPLLRATHLTHAPLWDFSVVVVVVFNKGHLHTKNKPHRINATHHTPRSPFSF